MRAVAPLSFPTPSAAPVPPRNSEAKSQRETAPSMTVGDKLILAVYDIAFGGEGVARLDEFVIFVPYVLVGEVVEAQVTAGKRRFAHARLLKGLPASPRRGIPTCPYI